MINNDLPKAETLCTAYVNITGRKLLQLCGTALGIFIGLETKNHNVHQNKQL